VVMFFGHSYPNLKSVFSIAELTAVPYRGILLI
jgi:hypothetical protein